MKLVFMGTPEFSAHILKELAKEHEIKLVFTQTDKKVGRKGVLSPSPVKVAALELNLPVFEPTKLKNNELACNMIKDCAPDFIIVAAYGKILPKSILSLAPCINTHASLLPKYRGASPIQAAIKAGERISGMSIMHMDEGLDTGDVILQEELEISDQNSQEVFNKMSVLGAKLLLKYLAKPDDFIAHKQNNSQATHCGMINKTDGLVDFSDAQRLYCAFLAYYMWPNVFLRSNLKLCDLSLIETESSNVAGVIKSINKNGIVVGCLKGSVLIKSVQPSGKKQMGARDYANGKRLLVGDEFL